MKARVGVKVRFRARVVVCATAIGRLRARVKAWVSVRAMARPRNMSSASVWCRLSLL